MSERQQRKTSRVELVETGNIAISLRRMEGASPYDAYRWRRALYHALAMSGAATQVELTKIRSALELP
jgi:hypothetical protein